MARVTPVQRKEDVLEVRLVDCRAPTTSKRASAFTSPSAGPSRASVTTLPRRPVSVTPGRPSKAPAGGRAVNVTSTRPRRSCAQRLDTLDEHEPPVADDRRPDRDALHLGERVRGEKHRAPLGGGLPEEVEHLLLHERVETRRRLVEDEQLRPVGERLDQADLLPVALRE